MKAPVALSLIVPAYNEERRIRYTLERTAEHLLRLYKADAFEVIVVDDGSSDATVRTAREFAASNSWVRVLTGAGNRGKGYATRSGVSAARGAVIGYMDADYKVPMEEIDKFLPLLESGTDVAIGSRRRDGAEIKVAQPLHRRLGSSVFAFLLHQLIGLESVSDTQCGFKFFRRDVALDLFGRQRIDGYMFDVEVLALTLRRGYRLAQVPIRWQNDPDSRYNVITGTIRNARELFAIRAALNKGAIETVPIGRQPAELETR